MTDDLIPSSPHKNFEDIKHIDENGMEYWEARELMPLMDYTDWRNFSSVILKAKEACRKSGQTIGNHFVDINKMIKIATGTDKETVRKSIEDIVPEDLPPEKHIKEIEREKRNS